MPEIKLSQGQYLAMLDDDSMIHQIWQGRAKSLKLDDSQIRLLHFSDGQELISWYQTQPKKPDAVFLCDYELIGQSLTGLDVIEKLGISREAILVTSRDEEQPIKDRCRRLGVKLIPKDLAGFVGISVRGPNFVADAVLIDDDELVRMAWSMQANGKNKALLVFSSPENFEESAERIDKETPIYIDSNLGLNIKGQDYAKKLFEQGFKNIYLATGYEPDEFKDLPWLKGILGKEPPF